MQPAHILGQLEDCTALAQKNPIKSCQVLSTEGDCGEPSGSSVHLQELLLG